jgi:hypothetical protein
MSERGTSSQVSVVFESHGRLEVEEERESAPHERRWRRQKVKARELLRERTPALPFIKQVEEVT